MTIVHHAGKVLSLGIVIFASSMMATLVHSFELVSPTAGGGMFVMDANGKNVGPVIGTGTGLNQLPKVGFEAGTGETFVLLASKSELQGSLLLVFQSRLCDGTPFMVDTTSESPFTPTAIAPPGKTLYTPVDGAMVQELTIGSAVSPSGDCSMLVENEADPDPMLPVVQAEGAMDMNTLFVAPFTVKLQ